MIIFIAKVIRINWALIPGSIFILKDIDFSSVYFFIGLGVVSLLVIIFAYLWYTFFSYCLTGTELQIKSGIFSKKLKTISYDRIQSLNTKQNPIFRMFKIVHVIIDTAGSSKQEVQLPGITLPQLKKIKDEVYSSKENGSDEHVDEVNKQDDKSKTKSLILYTFKDFFKIGITSNRFFIALAGLWATYNAMSENLNELLDVNIDDQLVEYTDQIDTTNILMFISVLLLIGIVIFLVFSVGGAIISYFDFYLINDKKAFRKKAGLLSKKEEVVALNKIQTVRFKQNFMHQFLKRFEIIFKQATSHIDVDESATFKIPLVDNTFIKSTLRNVFYYIKEDTFNPINKKYVWKYWSMFYFFPSIVLVSGLSFFIHYYAAILFLYPALGYMILRTTYLKWGYRIDDECIKIRKGLFGCSVTYLETYKVQSVEISQSPYQRRNALGSLRIYTAADILDIPYIEQDVLYTLFNEITYQIEKTQKKWF